MTALTDRITRMTGRRSLAMGKRRQTSDPERGILKLTGLATRIYSMIGSMKHTGDLLFSERQLKSLTAPSPGTPLYSLREELAKNAAWWDAILGLLLLVHGSERGQREYLHSNERLRQSATTDNLTGAGSRHGREMHFGAIQDLIEYRSEHVLVSMIMDVDRFKTINDTHGHATGDCVLQYLVEEVRKHLRPSDRIFRIGGDEFVVYLLFEPGDEVGEICSRLEPIAKRLAHDIADPINDRLAGDIPAVEPVFRGISLGIGMLIHGTVYSVPFTEGTLRCDLAVPTPLSETADIFRLVDKIDRAADQAMYQAKSVRP